ncbi:MAG: hypothetical protein ACI85K_002662 [Hyphomicrobiaceae bacterium]|jgi:hypothetical protein
MRLPAIKGLIARRVLVNYRVDVDVLQRVLPHPFRAQVVEARLACNILNRMTELGMPA